MEIFHWKNSPFLLTQNKDTFKSPESLYSQRIKPSTSRYAKKKNSVIRLYSNRNRTTVTETDDNRIASAKNQFQGHIKSKSNTQTLFISSIQEDSQKKYFLMPKMKKLKNLNTDIIDSILTLNNNNNHHHSISDNVNHASNKQTAEPKSIKSNLKRITDPLKIIQIENDKFKPNQMMDNLDDMIIMESKMLLMGNLNQSKKKVIFQSRNKESNTNCGTIKTKNYSSRKVGSMLERFLLKIFSPDDCIEDYVSSNTKGDKYRRFKTMLKKEKERISKIFSDNKQSQHINNQVLKLYTSQLRKKN